MSAVRVEVVTHFNEDPYSHGLVRGMADRLRAALEGVRCADHDIDSVVRLSTDGIAQTPNDIHVEIMGCCDPVAARVRRVVDDVRHLPRTD